MIKFPLLIKIGKFFSRTCPIWIIICIFVLATLYTNPIKAEPTEEQKVQMFKTCYGLGMIAFDSVINARLNVWPENAIAILDGMDEDDRKVYIRVILGAYMWDDDPHSYGILTYNDCLLNGI